MITYTVHEPPEAPADRLDRAESLVFIKDGFTWTAALFGPFWLAAHRLWLALLGYLIVYGLLHALVWMLGTGQNALSYALLALGVILGFEADTLRRWTLGRAGWRMVGSVNGRNAEDCERRFFEAWLPSQPYVAARALSQSTLAAGPEPAPIGGAPAPASGTDPASPRSKGWRYSFSLGGRRT